MNGGCSGRLTIFEKTFLHLDSMPGRGIIVGCECSCHKAVSNFYSIVKCLFLVMVLQCLRMVHLFALAATWNNYSGSELDKNYAYFQFLGFR